MLQGRTRIARNESFLHKAFCVGLASVALWEMFSPPATAELIAKGSSGAAAAATRAKQPAGCGSPSMAPIALPQGPLNEPLNTTPDQSTPVPGVTAPGTTPGAVHPAPNAGLNLNLSPAGTLNSTPVPPPAAAGAHHEHVGDIPIGGQSSTNTTAFLSGYLSVNQALNEALLKSPRAAAIRAQLRIQAAAYAAATVMMDPQLFRDESNDEQVVRIGPQSTYDPPWKLAFRFAVAKRQVQEQKLEFLNSLWAFRNQVRGAYLELVMAQESYNTLSELATLAERLAGISKRMYTAGSVAGLDVLKAELAAHQAAVDRDQGAGRVALAKQQLNIIMGRHPDATFMVARLPQFKARAEKTGLMPNLNKDVPPVNDFMEIALSNRLELRIVKAQMLVAEAQLRNVWGNIAPDPQVVTGYSATGNAPTGPKFKGEFWTMNYELPFFTYGQGDIVRLKATLRQYQMQILAQRNQIAADVSSGYNHLINARRKIASYQDHILAESERTAQLARRSYEVGQSDITSTLAAQQANVQVKQNYLDAVNTYQQAFTELEQAVGVPLI